jgi:uncharacterized repeat protein (TIGR01451 family)
MINRQPSLGTKARTQRQRKLTSALLASVLVWLPVTPANAVITNSVVATGTISGLPVTTSATANVDVQDANPRMTIVKSGILNDGSDGSADPGDTINYSFTITNTGNVTLQNISLVDTGATLTGSPIASLAPGAVDTLTFAATHILTAIDISTGNYTNSVIANAHAASGQNITASNAASTPLTVLSAMLLEKTGVLNVGSNGRADAGDTITYSFKVTNTGPTPLHDVKVSDPLVNLASLPGQSRMIAMLDAENTPSDQINTASIPDETSATSHFAAADAYVYNLSPEISVPSVETDLHAERLIVRMSGDSDALVAGDKIGFVYALTNTGNGPLTNINVVQADAVAYGETLDLLAPNVSDSANIIFTRVITAAEVAAGEVNAPASVTAKSRDKFFARQLPAKMALAGISNFDSFASATITPSLITNLNVGAFTTFNATYTLTQADVDAGFVDNTATATALNAVTQTLTSVSSFHQPLLAAPGVAVIKTGQVDLGADGVASIGDLVTYQFAITNTGNVTLNTVGLTDSNAVVAGALATPLAPGAVNTTTFSATHALTQVDIDAGLVSNQANVKATSPTGTILNVPSDNDTLTQADPTIVTLAAAPKIALLKTVFAVTDVNNNARTDVGDTITYHFAVMNTGNQTLSNILVTDPLVLVGDSNGNLPALPLPSLAPGQTDSTYFSSVYSITQADVDAGEVDNTAKAEGTAPGNVQVIDYSDPGVPTNDGPTISIIPAMPIISLIKTENGITDTNGNNLIDAGDVINYTFKVENQGNVTLANVNIVDNLAGAIVQGAAIPSLAPLTFDDTNFTASYTITTADVVAGRVTNQATAKGKPPIGADVSDLSDNAAPNQNNPTITAITPMPSIALIKTITSVIDVNTSGFTDAGDTINYTFSIKNTGNLPLNNVFVTDAPLNVLGLPITLLPAGNTDATTFTASHVINAADITAGQYSNQAKVQGTTISNTVVSDDSDNNSYLENDPTVAYFASSPKIALVKTVASTTDTNGSGTLDSGDVINYKLEVTNTGNVILNNITVTDTNAIVSGGPLATLAPNGVDSSTFSATHLVTNADFLAGEVINQAEVQATPGTSTIRLTDLSDGSSVANDQPTVTPLAVVPGIALIKTIKNIQDVNGDGLTDPDDIITYAFDVVNTGNVDLSNIVLIDTNAVIAPVSGMLATLPKATHNTTAFTATHVITIADAIAGFVSNSALISGTTPAAVIVTDTSDKATIAGNAPTITPVSVPKPVFTKTANKTEVHRGETVIYTITASNLLGTSYTVTDVMPAGFGFVAGSATINNAAIAAVAVGRDITFPSITPVAGKISIKLKLLASTTLAGGKFVNNAIIIEPVTGQVLARAQATVTIAIDAVFDCSDVIGHVFDDENANGYMDDGEPGLPGVRVVTLNGVLITTDSEGRYHVPCAAVPDAKIGSNYLLKLDTRTLPTGYKLTTENPRDVRVTRGKVVKLNFGATIAHEVKLDLSAKAFDEGTSELKSKWIAGLDKLVDVLNKKKATLKIVYHSKGEPRDLAEERLAAVQETITFAWENDKRSYSLVVTTAVESGK